eukprot:139791_1
MADHLSETTFLKHHYCQTKKITESQFYGLVGFIVITVLVLVVIVLCLQNPTRNEFQDIRTQLDIMRSKYQKCTKSQHKLETLFNKTKLNLNELNTSNQLLQQYLASNVSKVQQLTDGNEKLTDDNKKLHEQNGKKDERITQLETESNSTKEQIEQLKQKVDTRKQQSDSAEHKITINDAEIERLQKKEKTLQQMYDNLLKRKNAIEDEKK